MAGSRIKDQEFRRALVIRVGELMHGPRWIAPLAADLSRVTGRAVGGPQISHYLSSARPFPDWIENGLLRVMQTRIAEILDEGRALKSEVTLLQERLAAQLAPEPHNYTPPLRGYSSPRMKPVAPEPEPEPEEEAPTPSMGM